MGRVIPEFQGKYRFLSNFWPAVVKLDGVQYPSVEAAYQAAKCANVNDRDRFIGLGPSQAKRLGRMVPIRADWDEVKLPLMLHLLRQKFAPHHEELHEQLRNTGDAELVEGNYWNDTFWGVCRGVGENNLGKLLMQVREENKSHEAHD